MSSAITARWWFNSRKVGLRPRGSRPVEPSSIHLSLIRSSTISETVLRCRPETRARSARERGWRVRTRLKTRFRLIWRGVLFDALCLRVNVNRDAGEVGMISLSGLKNINVERQTKDPETGDAKSRAVSVSPPAENLAYG